MWTRFIPRQYDYLYQISRFNSSNNNNRNNNNNDTSHNDAITHESTKWVFLFLGCGLSLKVPGCGFHQSSKTEFLLIGTKQQRLKFSNLTSLSLSNDIIPVSSSARNLGFIFDSDMSFSDQIKSVSKSCHFHIRDIRRIRHLLPLSAATALANSLVSSKLDYCNSLYSGISQANLNKLQRIQNSLARVITNTSKYQHITPILKNYTGFQSNKESITNSVFLHTKHLQINNLHIFTIVFHFRHILFLQDLLIHLFFPFHMSDHHLAKGLSLSLVHDSGIHFLLTPETRLLYQYSVPDSKHTSSKLLSLPRLFPISLDCLPGFWFLLFSFYALSNDT